MNEPSPNGRTLDGRFAPRNAISQGNLGNKRMKALRRALLDCATEEKIKAVEKALYDLAIGGDVTAAKVWLDHVIGRPLQAVELSGPDGQAMEMEVLMAAVAAGLESHPEASVDVAAALMEVSRAYRDGLGGDVGEPD
jgi:hypothetical protein